MSSASISSSQRKCPHGAVVIPLKEWLVVVHFHLVLVFSKINVVADIVTQTKKKAT